MGLRWKSWTRRGPGGLDWDRFRFRFTSAAKAESVAAELESMRLKEAAKVVREGFAETLAYCEMPREHWRCIRTNNAIERLNREKQGDKARTRVVGTFPVGPHAGGRLPEIRRGQ